MFLLLLSSSHQEECLWTWHLCAKFSEQLPHGGTPTPLRLQLRLQHEFPSSYSLPIHHQDNLLGYHWEHIRIQVASQHASLEILSSNQAEAPHGNDLILTTNPPEEKNIMYGILRRIMRIGLNCTYCKSHLTSVRNTESASGPPWSVSRLMATILPLLSCPR